MSFLSRIVFRLPAPLFTKPQLRMLATIFADLGQVLAAGLVIPFFLGTHGLINGIAGLTLTTIFWILSLLFSRERIWMI